MPAASIQIPAPRRDAAARTESYGSSFYPGVPSVEMATPIPVRAGDVQRVDMRLRKRTLPRVTGVLEVPESASGTPSLQVQQNFPGSYTRIASASIKAGPFEIRDLDKGEYVILATTTGEASSDRFSAEYHLSMGTRDVEDLKLVLQRGLAIDGSVRLAEGESGAALDGIWVGLDPVERARGPSTTARTAIPASPRRSRRRIFAANSGRRSRSCGSTTRSTRVIRSARG